MVAAILRRAEMAIDQHQSPSALSCSHRPDRRWLLRAVGRYLDPVGHVEPDAVAQRAHGHAEQTCRMGAVAVAAAERLHDELALDFRKWCSDQERNDLVRGPPWHRRRQ